MNKSYSKIRHLQESNRRLEKRFLAEGSMWNDVFGEPDIKDVARSAYKSKGHSMMGKDDEQRRGDYYIVFDGEKYFPEQIQYADYQDLGELPRVEDGMLIVPNPVWNS